VNDLVESGKTEVVLVAVELIGNGGQIDKMTHNKTGPLLSRQTRECLTDPCVMAFLTVHRGTSVRAFVGGREDPAAEGSETERKEWGSMNSQQSETSTAAIAIVRRDELDFAAGVVTVLVLENAPKEQT